MNMFSLSNLSVKHLNKILGNEGDVMDSWHACKLIKLKMKTKLKLKDYLFR